MSPRNVEGTEELKRKASRAALWSFLQSFSAKVIGFGVFLVLARLLTPEEFGLVALATTVLLLAQLLVEQGFEEVLVQRSELLAEHLDTAFWVSVLLGTCAAGALALSAPLAAAIFGEPRLEPIILVLSPTLIIASLTKVQLGLQRRTFGFRGLAVRQIVASLGGGGVGIGMAVSSFGVWSLVGRHIAEGLVGMLLLWGLTPWRPGLRVRAREFKEMFSFGSNIFLSNILGYLSLRADSLVVGYFLGPGPLGLYTVGQRSFQLVLDGLQGALHQVALSLFSRLQHDKGRLRRAFLQIVEVSSTLAFPVFGLFIVVGGDIVPLLFGPHWSSAGTLLPILSVGGLLFCVSYFNGSVMKAVGKPNLVLMLVAINAITNLVGFLVAVQFGLAAVAIAFVVRGYLVYPLNLRLTTRILDLRTWDYFAVLVPAGLCSFAAAACGVAVNGLALSGTWLRVVSVLLTGGVVYLVLLRAFFPSTLRVIVETAKGAVGAGGGQTGGVNR